MAEISSSEFERQARAGRFELKPVITVTGDDPFICEETLRGLRRHLENSGYTLERFDDAERPASELIRSLRTASLFGGKTAILVRSQRMGNRQEIAARFKDELLEYLDAPNKHNLLLIHGVTWNGSMAVPKRVKQDFLVIECAAFKPWQRAEIESFVEGRAALHGLKLSGGVAARLQDTCGANLALIERELEKLALTVEGRAVTSADLDAQLQYHGEGDAFALCDAILEGNRRLALSLATKVMRDGDPGPILQFLGLLGAQWRKAGKLAFLLRSGVSPATALGQAGFNPRSPKARSLTATAQGLTRRELLEKFEMLLEADSELKSGAPEPQAVMTTLIARMCERKTRSASDKQSSGLRTVHA
ncbi:MAG: DNA polymerase III subunit delta [Planctomycetes bacterium]|nr:DNA polymerase III subunit delta [Planctomycetota bacterium]NUQ35766.1 DNA polymerase III subunit delta [Planctomycetaceae bacterium]